MIEWLNERTGIKDQITKQLEYPIPAHANIWICFGGLAFFLIVLQVLTVAFLFIHTVNVITRRAYKSPRELSWWSGLLLLLLMFFFMGTGIILPWDWRSYWELVVWADWFGTIPIIGERLIIPFISAFTIGKSFVIHVWVLPAIVLFILIFHLRMVRKLG